MGAVRVGSGPGKPLGYKHARPQAHETPARNGGRACPWRTPHDDVPGHKGWPHLLNTGAVVATGVAVLATVALLATLLAPHGNAPSAEAATVGALKPPEKPRSSESETQPEQEGTVSDDAEPAGGGDDATPPEGRDNEPAASSTAVSDEADEKPAPAPTLRRASPAGSHRQERWGYKPPAPPTAAVEQAKTSIALIQGRHGMGSGFVVLPHVVATNWHVIRDELIGDLAIRFISDAGIEETSNKVQLLFEDPERDLALLLMPAGFNRPALKTRTTFEPAPDQTVFVVGNPAQSGQFMRLNAAASGTASETVLLDSNPFFLIRVTNGGDEIGVGRGNSGGPVLDSAGRVIGMLTAGIENQRTHRPTGKVFCIPAHVLKRALDGLGRPAQWPSRVKHATTKHISVLAVANLDARATIAQAVVRRRVELVRSTTPVFWPRVLERDRTLVKRYRDTDRELRRLAKPALAAAKTCPGAHWPEVRALLVSLDQVCKPAGKNHSSRAEYKQWSQDVARFEDRLKRLEKRLGVTERLAKEMRRTVLDGAPAIAVER